MYKGCHSAIVGTIWISWQHFQSIEVKLLLLVIHNMRKIEILGRGFLIILLSAGGDENYFNDFLKLLNPCSLWLKFLYKL